MIVGRFLIFVAAVLVLSVAPFVGAWIETENPAVCLNRFSGRSFRRSED